MADNIMLKLVAFLETAAGSTQVANLQRQLTEIEKQLKPIKISADFNNLNEDLSKINVEKLSELSSCFDKITQGVKSLHQGFILTGKDIKKTTDNIVAASTNGFASQVKGTDRLLKKVENFHSSYLHLEKSFTTFTQNNPRFAARFDGEVRGALAELNTISNDFFNGKVNTSNILDYEKRLKELTNKLLLFKNQANASGTAGLTFWDKLKNAAQKFSDWSIATKAVMGIRNQFVKMVDNVKELDKAMTELKKVTNETNVEYDKFLSRAAARAKDLGATLVDTVQSTADFSRLGFSLDQAEDLADSAIVLKNVGDGIDNITESSEMIISTMKAFNVEAKDAMSIVNKYNEVGNRFAVSTSGIGTAMQKSASALAYANNTLDESIALVVAANATVQDPEVVGTALKTLSMRLRSSTAELEEAGLETEGMAETTATLRKELMALAGVDIMLDDTTIKSTYQIMTELADVWNTMTDIESAAVLELVAGKRMANTAASIIQNIQEARDAYHVSAHESTDSATEENAKYLESIQGHISKLNSTYESFSQNLIDDEAVKVYYKALTGLLELLDSFVDKVGSLPTLIGAVTIGLNAWGKNAGIVRLVEDTETLSGYRLEGIFKNLQSSQISKSAKEFNSMMKMMSGFSGNNGVSYEKILDQLEYSFGDNQEIFAAAKNQLDSYRASLVGASDDCSGFGINIRQINQDVAKVGISAQGAAIGIKVLKAAINTIGMMAFSAAISFAVQELIKLANADKTALENAKGLDSEYEELTKTVEELKKEIKLTTDKIDELKSKGPLTFVEANELQNLKNTNSELQRTLTIQEALWRIAQYDADKAGLEAYKKEKDSVDVRTGEDGSKDYYAHERDFYVSYKDSSEGSWSKHEDLLIDEQIDLYIEAANEYKRQKEELEGQIANLENEIKSNSYSDPEQIEVTKGKISILKDQIAEIDSYYVGYKALAGESAKKAQEIYDTLNGSTKEGKEAQGILEEAMIRFAAFEDPDFVSSNVIDILTSSQFSQILDKLIEAKKSSQGNKLTADVAQDVSKSTVAYNDFEEALRNCGGTWEIVTELINAGDYSEAIRKAKELEDAVSFTKLKEELTKVAEAFDKLKVAADEYAETGTLSLESFEELIKLGPEYLKLLFDENGQLSLNKERIAEVTSAYMDQITYKQVIATIDAVTALKSEEKQLEALSLAAEEASGNLEQFAKNYVISKYVAAQDPIGEDVLDGLLTYVEQAFEINDLAKKGAAQTYGGTADEFAKARAALEHELNMGRISQAEFWDELEKLRDRYFVKGSAEWTEYYREIEKGRDELLEEALKLEGEMAIKAIEKKIDAKKKELEQLEEEYEAEDKLFELQKARDRYEAAKRNLNTRLYTEDKGWVWVADPTELQNSREELEELEREHAREEAKKAIEDEIEALEDLKDKYQEALDQIGMDLQEHADMLEWLAEFEEMTYDELAAYLEEYADKVVAEYERIADAKRKAAEADDGVVSNKNPNTGPSKNSYPTSSNTFGEMYKKSSGGNTVTSSSADLGAGKAKNSYPTSSNTFSQAMTKTSTTTKTTTTTSKLNTSIYQLVTGKKASGALSIDEDGTYLVDEVGPELIARHNEAGRLTHLELGDTVFPADMTQRLWDLAATGAFALASASRIPVRTNLHEGAFAAKQSVSSSNDIVLTGCTFELNNVTDVDTFFGELNRIANRHRRK